MNYLVCYEIGTGAGWISGDCVVRNGQELTEDYLVELRNLLRETAVREMAKEIPAGTQLKNVIFRYITKIG